MGIVLELAMKGARKRNSTVLSQDSGFCFPLCSQEKCPMPGWVSRKNGGRSFPKWEKVARNPWNFNEIAEIGGRSEVRKSRRSGADFKAIARDSACNSCE